MTDNLKPTVYRFDPSGWNNPSRKMDVFYDCEDGSHFVTIATATSEENGRMIADALNRRAPDARLEAERAVIEAAKEAHKNWCEYFDEKGKNLVPNLTKALAALARYDASAKGT